MTLQLKRAMLAALGVAALGGISTQASAALAFGGAADSGAVQGAQSWNGNNNGYLGWAHTSDWFTVKVPAAGNVDIKVTGSAGVRPGFTVWSTGAAEYTAGPQDMTYNQIGGTTSWLPASFVGFANNYSGDAHFGHGPADPAHGGPAARAGAAAITGVDGGGHQYAELIFPNAAANNWYVLAVGGSGGSAGSYTVRAAPAAASPVPLPAAAWLLGSALAGLGVFGRRKTAA
jgi:hypothetical protein